GAGVRRRQGARGAGTDEDWLMKILTVRQAYASLIVAGHKTLEWRNWRTSYRGPLLILAAKQRDRSVPEEQVRALLGCASEELPIGGIIGLVQLVDILRREQVASSHPWFDLNYAYAWVLAGPRQLPFTPLAGKL